MNRVVLLVAASAGMLAACSRINEMDLQEKPILDNESLVKQVIFEAPEIRFMGEDGETRASLSQVGDGTVSFAWEATDTVGIFPSKGSQVYFEMTDGAGDKVAKFDGGAWALRDGASYSCYFPFVCDMKLDRNAIPISFAGQKQTGVSTHDGVYYVLASEPKSPQSGNIRFQFQMLNTIIRLKLYGLPAGTYTKLSLTTEEPLFVQDGTFSIDNMNITGKTFSNSLDMTLEDFTLTEAATEANPVFLYVTSAPVDFTGKKLTVQMYSADDRLFKCEKTPSKPCEAGTWYAYKCPMEESCVKYTKTSSISVGSTYLIVDANDQRLFKGAKDGSFMSITPENTVITDHDGSLAAYEFTVEKTAEKYYLKFNDGKYLVCNYNGNSTAGLAYVNSQAEVQYPYALTTGNNGAFFFSTTQVNSAANTDQVLYYKAEDKVFKIGGSGRTIGVQVYMKDGKLDRGLSFNPESVSCLLGETPEKPVLSGIYTTVTYSSSDDKIARVDASGKVTTVNSGTVTITATAAEDDQYGAGSASYTLNILKAAPGGWVAMETVNLENKALYDYLNDAENSYTDTDDATNTVIAKYTGAAYSSISRKDCPAPVTITWTNNASKSTVISIFESDALQDPVCTQNASEGATSADVYNLIPGRTYYYSVSENGNLWEKGYFSTTGRRRMLKVSDSRGRGYANNCRDLGGLKVTDNGVEKTIRYGLLFRGTNMDRTTKNVEWPILLDFMNVGMDIDLRNGQTTGTIYSSDGSQTRNRPLPDTVAYTAPGFMDGKNFDDFKKVEKIREVVMAFINTVRSGKAVYFHCYSGADRTGYISMLIEGLLGVSEKDCSIDYELTSFCSPVGDRYRTGKPTDYDFRDGITFLRALPGTTFQNKIETYLVNQVGISQSDINDFKSLMLE